jgi:hypothetical protein
MLPLPRPVRDIPEVRELCQELVADTAPIWFNVDTPNWASPNDCTENVDRVIELHGGRVEYGWQLWETLPELMIEAEFHAVWVDNGGRRYDVTPKQVPGIDSIVFLPDPNLVYEGRQIDNVRRSLVDDPLIDDLIEVNSEFFTALNRGALAEQHGEISMTPEIRAILDRQQAVEMAIAEKYFSGP